MKVLIADDHRLIIQGIRRALEDVDDIDIVGEATNGSQVLPMIGRTDPDLVLMDIRMPGIDGLACLDLVKKRFPGVKVVFLSAFDDADHIQAALRRGAAAYIVKSVNPLDIATTLRQAVEGAVFHACGLPEEDGESSALKASGLTEREMAILRAVASGLSNQAIGQQLWVTEQTVKFHLTNIYRKLGVANRTEAARHAYNSGLVSVA